MSGKRISREKLTIKKMIDLYQAKCPQASAEPEHYEALFVYAQKRLDKCVFGEEKPACKQCPVHCYQPAKREEMIQRSGRTTVPQIFIDAQHIGGCDDLYALDSRGGLDPLLR